MAMNQKEAIRNLIATSEAVIRSDCDKIQKLATAISGSLDSREFHVSSLSNQLAGLGADLARHAALLSTLTDLETRE
jgi:hypothetical protein